HGTETDVEFSVGDGLSDRCGVFCVSRRRMNYSGRLRERIQRPSPAPPRQSKIVEMFMQRRQFLKSVTCGTLIVSECRSETAASCPGPSCSDLPSHPPTLPLSDRTSHRKFPGVAHISGAYSLLKENAPHYLREGAEQILELGCETIKLSLLRPASSYPFHAQWDPSCSGSSLCTVQSPYFREVLALPFRTIILWTYSDIPDEHYWNSGPITANQAIREETQFFRIASYLYETYRGTGKEFILTHWEGDWAVRGHTDAQRDPTPESLEGMRQWLTARQRGVDRARREYESSRDHSSLCRVYHAAEVNLVGRCLNRHGNRPGVATQVITSREAPLDLVSYSAYDTQQNSGDFRASLELLADHLPIKPEIDGHCGGRRGRVFVGEYGYPENAPDAEQILPTVVENVQRIAAESGCLWTVFWQLYCNEAIRRPVEKNEDGRGFWLIRPDGTKTPLWKRFHEQLTRND
ncbi:MAG: hypothetical protein Q4C47_00220, partial [Planctomycetia bacterium]|nr:hypothetical protein [Planctomycetia bacterium]